MSNVLTNTRIASAVGLALVLSFAVGLVTTQAEEHDADALIEQLQSQIAELEAQLAGLDADEGTPTVTDGLTPVDFSGNMGPGSTGANVQQLQEWLNENGFEVASTGAGSPGNETSYYGSKTQSAVGEFQDEYGVSYGDWRGYWGPDSRSAAEAAEGVAQPVDPVNDEEDGDDEDGDDEDEGEVVGYGTAADVTVTEGLSQFSGVSLTLVDQGGDVLCDYSYAAAEDLSATELAAELASDIESSCTDITASADGDVVTLEGSMVFGLSDVDDILEAEITEMDDGDDEDDEPLPDVEGRISASRLASPGNKLGDLETGDENVTVYGFEVEAQDSQIDVRRVDLILESDATEREMARMFDEVSLVVGGETIATQSVTRDNMLESGNDYELRLSGFNERVAAEETQNFQIQVSVTSDSRDVVSDSVDVYVPGNGIRGVDQAGLNQFNSSDLDPRSFSVDDPDAEVEVSENDNSPDEQIILADEDSSTDDVRLLSFDVEVDGDTVELFDVTATTSADSGDDHDQFLGNINLVQDGSVIASEAAQESAGDVAYTFSEVDLELEEGTHTFHIEADLLPWASGWEGTILSASVDPDVNGWTGEDTEGDEPAWDGNAAGEDQHIYTTAPTGLSLTDRSLSVTGDDQEIASGMIAFSVTASNDDIYIADVSGTGAYADSSAGTGTLVDAGDALSATAEGNWSAEMESLDADEVTNGWLVKEGETETFEVYVVIEGDPTTDGLGGLRVLLGDIRWTDSETDLDSWTGLNGMPGDILSDYRTPRETARVY